ncbi:hypothetical protein [Nitratidesulfovibrio liaohensis]|uniref:Uncharacterized protein n=1 Tax=Nitratidesulfovibrio liaohensis TaxID=2604158 RepID=A0ABY9R470_9BACT|nr:hypothetical protein [Nitratidesulfovibrio liaohensis]WMW66548.1 hypothetical protein KPS_001136 [Nitratidesulfovibrio liaohensis]
MDIGDATSSRGLAAYSRALTRDAGDALGLLSAKRTKTAFSLGPLTVSYETETAPTELDAAVQAAESLHRMRAFNFADSLQTQQLLAELAPLQSAPDGDFGAATPLDANPDAVAGAASTGPSALTGEGTPTRTPAAGARAYARSASLVHGSPMIQTAV